MSAKGDLELKKNKLWKFVRNILRNIKDEKDGRPVQGKSKEWDSELNSRHEVHLEMAKEAFKEYSTTTEYTEGLEFINAGILCAMGFMKRSRSLKQDGADYEWANLIDECIKKYQRETLKNPGKNASTKALEHFEIQARSKVDAERDRLMKWLDSLQGQEEVGTTDEASVKNMEVAEPCEDGEFQPDQKRREHQNLTTIGESPDGADKKALKMEEFKTSNEENKSTFWAVIGKFAGGATGRAVGGAIIVLTIMGVAAATGVALGPAGIIVGGAALVALAKGLNPPANKDDPIPLKHREEDGDGDVEKEVEFKTSNKENEFPSVKQVVRRALVEVAGTDSGKAVLAIAGVVATTGIGIPAGIIGCGAALAITHLRRRSKKKEQKKKKSELKKGN